MGKKRVVSGQWSVVRKRRSIGHGAWGMGKKRVVSGQWSAQPLVADAQFDQ